MLITWTAVHQVPRMLGPFLEGLEKCDDGVPVRDGECLEPVTHAGGLAAVALDRLLQRGGLSIEEGLGVAQIEQRLGAEILGGRAPSLCSICATPRPSSMDRPPRWSRRSSATAARPLACVTGSRHSPSRTGTPSSHFSS